MRIIFYEFVYNSAKKFMLITLLLSVLTTQIGFNFAQTLLYSSYYFSGHLFTYITHENSELFLQFFYLMTTINFITRFMGLNIGDADNVGFSSNSI